MNKPLVTVITATYNSGKFLSETIESIAAQNYKNIEHIILNDGSTDNTEEILSKYKHLKVFTHPNMGETKTVNKGISFANGKYFMLTNADDPLLPNAINTLVDFMEKRPNLLAAYPDWIKIDQNGNRLEYIKMPEYNFIRMALRHAWAFGVGAIYKTEIRNIVGLRNPKYKYMADCEHFLRTGLAGDIARIPYTLATWRQHENQMSQQKGIVLAEEHTKVTNWLFSQPNLPPELLKRKNEAMFWTELSYKIAQKKNPGNLKLLAIKTLIKYPSLITNYHFYKEIISTFVK